MSDLHISYENLTALTSTHPPNQPIYMLNLWRYRPTALYPPQYTHLSSSPCTGEEAMTRYLAALRPITPSGASVHFKGKALANVVAPEGDEMWDVVAIVRYETLAGFREMVESKVYKEEVEGHKVAALEDQRLVVLDEME
jgi:hypothetical protein